MPDDPHRRVSLRRQKENETKAFRRGKHDARGGRPYAAADEATRGERDAYDAGYKHYKPQD